MNLIPSEQLERSRAFETAQKYTIDALADPSVQQDLGSLAVEIGEAANNLILPNVRHGRVEIGEKDMLSNNLVLLPHLPAEQLVYGPQLLLPTRQRYRQTVNEAAERWGVDRERAVRVMSALVDSVFDHDVTVELSDMHAKKVNGATQSLVVDDGRGMAYRTRPVIHMTTDRITAAHPYRVAGTAAHEIAHGLNREARSELDNGQVDRAYNASDELRGYHVGAVIRKAGGVLAGDGNTQKVEELRQQHTTPDAPYAASEELIAKLDQLGVLRPVE